MVSFENFVKSMLPNLSELKVTPSFCFAFKIPYDPTATNYLQYFPAAVVISFFVCWTPFHTQRLGYVFFAHLQNDAGYIFRTINEFLYSISGICYYASSTMNPILYNMMSSRYRQAFKNTLCGLTGSKYLI